MTVEIEIVKYVPPGDGLGYHDGKAVFVPATAVGDVVQARILKEKKRFIIAALDGVVHPSPDRMEADCPHYERCGGCSLMHFSYEKQLSLKRQMLIDVFSGFSISVDPEIVPSPYNHQFRFRSQLKCSDGSVGFSERNSNRVVNISHCRILAPAIMDAIPKSRQLGRVDCDFRFLASLNEGTVSLTVVEKGRINPIPGFPQSIVEDYGFGPVNLNSDGFSQSNPYVTRLIIDDLLAEGKGVERICELYCGSGTFSIPMAQNAVRLTGMDIDRKAIETSIDNASINGLANTEFTAINLEKSANIPSVDCILADPPRKGLSKTVLANIGRSQTRKLLYVSCNPATLARDARGLMTEYGFSLAKLKGYDMYCHSTHLEALAVFAR